LTRNRGLAYAHAAASASAARQTTKEECMPDQPGPENRDPQQAQPSFQVRIPLEWDDAATVSTVYANQVVISHGGPEFCLVFGFVVPPLNTAQLPDALRIQPQVRVVIAREAMPAIVQAMVENLRRAQGAQPRPAAPTGQAPAGTPPPPRA
jgi:hypothetical protein